MRALSSKGTWQGGRVEVGTLTEQRGGQQGWGGCQPHFTDFTGVGQCDQYWKLQIAKTDQKKQGRREGEKDRTLLDPEVTALWTKVFLNLLFK